MINEKEKLERESIILCNARRLIKEGKNFSNGKLCAELFGTGMRTGRDRACRLGLDPDSSITSYGEMMKYIDKFEKEQ